MQNIPQRHIILDTETTGLNPENNHRIIEIGCIELIDSLQTGKIFHEYINPQRNIPAESHRIHGISEEFLQDKPFFSTIADRLWQFLDNATLIAHNASFDISFLNAEFKRLNMPQLDNSKIIDTLELSRKQFPNTQVSLDALCRRFKINLDSRKDYHGALLDAQLLAQVYIELVGGLQHKMDLGNIEELSPSSNLLSIPSHQQQSHHTYTPEQLSRPHAPSAEELKRHAAFMQKYIETSR